MYTGFKHLHSSLAYLALLFILVAVIYAFYGWLNNKPFTKGSKTIALLGLIAVHIQFLVGLVLYFVSPLGSSNFSKEAMGNSQSRLFILEHPLTMLLGIILVTIGYSRSKRAATAQLQYKSIALFYLVGILLILSRIPWQIWP